MDLHSHVPIIVHLQRTQCTEDCHSTEFRNTAKIILVLAFLLLLAFVILLIFTNVPLPTVLQNRRS